MSKTTYYGHPIDDVYTLDEIREMYAVVYDQWNWEEASKELKRKMDVLQEIITRLESKQNWTLSLDYINDFMDKLAAIHDDLTNCYIDINPATFEVRLVYKKGLAPKMDVDMLLRESGDSLKV